MLTKSELMENEDDEDEWGNGESGTSMELGNSDIMDADTSTWDPFRDAHKFEALAAAEQ